MPTAVKSAAPRRGDLVNDANTKLEGYRQMLYPVALATLAGAGLAGAGQLYKHLEVDRFEPDEASPDLDASRQARQRAIARFRRAAGSAWEKPAAAKDDFDSLSWPQKLLINRDEYSKAKPGISKIKYQAEGPNIGGHVVTIGGMLAGSLLANQALNSFLENRRLQRSRETAMLSELEMRSLGDKMVGQSKPAAFGLPDAVVENKPNWVQRAVSPIGNAAWMLTLAGLGAGGIGGALLSRNVFHDRKREYNADQIKSWMKDKRYQEFQDALADDYFDAAAKPTKKEAGIGLLPFAKGAASANEGSVTQTVGELGTGIATAGRIISGPLGWIDGGMALAGLPSVGGAVSHIGGTALSAGTNAVSNIARGRGIGGMVTDNLDAAYKNSDQVTRHKMSETIGKAGENMGSSGAKIRRSMENIAGNPDFRRGMTGAASGKLGADPAAKSAIDLSEVWGNIKDTASNAVSNAGRSVSQAVQAVPGQVAEWGVNTAGRAARAVGRGISNAAQSVSDTVGTLTGNADGTVIAKKVADSIPGKVADQVSTLEKRVSSSPSAAEQAGRDMASGKMDMGKGAAEEIDNVQEYTEDVAEGVAHGVKSTVGNRMSNRASGAAVNLAINPEWHKGMFGMAGNIIGGQLGINGQNPGVAKAAAGNAEMSHAFRRAGESIGKSPEMTEPLAKALNDSVVPDTVKNVTDKYLPQGSFMGLGDHASSAINGIFSPGDPQKQAGVWDYIRDPFTTPFLAGLRGETEDPNKRAERALKGMVGGAIGGAAVDALIAAAQKKPISPGTLALNAGIGATGMAGVDYLLSPHINSLGKYVRNLAGRDKKAFDIVPSFDVSIHGVSPQAWERAGLRTLLGLAKKQTVPNALLRAGFNTAKEELRSDAHE